MTTETEAGEIAGRMESIGRNCEFGFVQRKLDVDPISLLRWAGAPTEGLIAGLQTEFAGLGDDMTGRPDPPQLEPDRQEWWLTCRRYDIVFHSGQNVARNSMAQATVIIRPRLRWLADKLLADLRAAKKCLFIARGRSRNRATG